jgi:hypothetical protein
MDLQAQSTTIRDILHDPVRGRVIIVSANGVDVYRFSDWQRLAWAVLPGCTCGAINDHGIWLGTSAAGIYLLPHSAASAATTQLAKAYDTATAVALPSNAIAALSGCEGHLAAVHDEGVSFFPNRNWAYHCTIAGGAAAVAIEATQIAYAAAEQIYLGDLQYADWATTAHTNLTGAGTVAALALRGTTLFVAGSGGLYTSTGITLTAIEASLGSAAPSSLWPTTDATATTGYLAYGTSDGAEGGEYGVIDLAFSPASLPTVAGDTSAVWVDDDGYDWAWEDNLYTGGAVIARAYGDTAAVWVADDVGEGFHNTTLVPYHQVAELSPAANATGVRRDWTLSAGITDRLGGIATGSVTLKVNGVSQTPSVSELADGFTVTYTPAGNSGYNERVAITLSATDSGGNPVSRTWVFTTASAQALTTSDAAPPNVVCKRDIGLPLAESDETVDGVNVVWLDTHTSPLIVTEAQAREVGRVKIDETTFHRHRVGVRVLATDAGTLQTRDLRPGSIATITCAALGMTAQKCEILAAQRTIDDSDEDISFDLQAAYYEEV